MEHDRDNGEPPSASSQPASATAESAAVDSANAALDSFRMTVELAPVGMCQLAPSGQFLYVNAALCQLMGYSREELLGLTFQRATHLDDDARRLAALRRFLSGETAAYHLDLRHVRRDGSTVWMRVSLTPRRAISGAPLSISGGIEDISERKRLEDQLRATNRKLAQRAQESQQEASDLEATFEAITDLIVAFDATGQVRRANRATLEFMGRHPTLEAGRRRLGLTDTQGQPLPAEEWVSARVLRGETLTGDQAIDLLAGDAASAGRNVLFNVSGAPVRDPQGQITGGVIVLRDVTERRELERRTQRSLQALLQMAEALVAPSSEDASALPDHGGPDRPATLNPVMQRLAELTGRVLGCERVGIVALERGGTTMHAVALTGMPAEEAAGWLAGLDGRNLRDFIDEDCLRDLQAGRVTLIDLNREPIRSVARGGPVALAAPLRLGEQLVGAMALGYEREPHAYTADELALAQAVGQLAALVIERERLQQEREEARANALALREANRRMDEFMSIAAHELRTPLTSLLMNLDLLERRFADEPLTDRAPEQLVALLRRVDMVLGLMSRQGRRLDRLISDMVDASRVRTGKLEFRPRRSDLAAIVREAVEEQRQAQPHRVIALALPEDTPALVVVDAERVGQVVTNYLTNALKYSRRDQPVEVRLRVHEGVAHVSVRDHGPGLPPEEQSRVWELFHRAPGIEVQSGSGIGLGLGLHICKTIVESHGGQVGVESAVGDGATFWFTLPLANDTGSAS